MGKKDKNIKAVENIEVVQITSDYVINYGKEVSENLSSFSTELLRNMTVERDTEDDIDGLFEGLTDDLMEIEPKTILNEKDTFLDKILKRNRVEQSLEKIINVEQTINIVKDKMEEIRYNLQKDIDNCYEYLERNNKYIEEVTYYIVEGKKRIEIEEKRLSKIKEKDLATLERQRVQLEISNLERFKRKITDLELMREVAIQNNPQIMLIIEGDSILVEKISDSINTTIPLWESQMIVFIQIIRQRNALKLQKNMNIVANVEMIKNSDKVWDEKSGIVEKCKTDLDEIKEFEQQNKKLIKNLNEIKERKHKVKEISIKS